MTETRTDLGICGMGSKTEHPCPFPATVELPHKFGDGYGLYAYHAATEPLVDEANELGAALEMIEAYLKDAREYTAAWRLVEALERIEADFSARMELAEKVLKDLEAAEFKLMRS